MRLQIRTPGDLESLEFAAFDRVPPGPGQIEVAVTASSVNFADVLVAFGRYPTFEGHRQQLGIDFAGVVTAVGPGRHRAPGRRPRRGHVAERLLEHVRHVRRPARGHAARRSCR